MSVVTLYTAEPCWSPLTTGTAVKLKERAASNGREEGEDRNKNRMRCLFLLDQASDHSQPNRVLQL